MTIVQLCGWYFPDSLGGTETYVAGLAEVLRAEGHDVRIAAPDSAPDAGLGEEPGGERSYEHDGVPVFRYPIAASPTRPEVHHEEPVRGAERLHAWLQRLRPDVVHLHTFVTGVGLQEIRAAKAAGAQVVVTTHSGALGFLCQRGSMMQWGTRPCNGRVTPAKCSACVLQERGVPAALTPLVAGLPVVASAQLGRLPGRLGTGLGLPALIGRNRQRQRQMLEMADAFVVLTEWARRAVLADAPDAPVVLNRLGVRTPPARRPSRPSASPLVIAYVGRFDEVKGVHDLARAVRALPASLPVRVEFRGPMRSARDRAVAAELQAILAGDPRVTISDSLAPEAVYDYLESIDLLCCPSRTLEGGPTVALEAMAVGVPVVATRLGAMAEVLTDGVNGRLLPPGDVDALALVLRAVVADPSGTLGRWRAALPPVRTMQDVARQYLGLYRPAAEECA